MKTYISSLFFALVIFGSNISFGQTNFADFDELMTTDFSDCAAIFYKGRMLVDDYSPNGKCKLEEGMKGKISLSTVALSEDGATPTKSINFNVAILHGDSNTLWQLTTEPVSEILLEDILKECKSGDKIIILTADKKYTLPHHEIDVIWGC